MLDPAQNHSFRDHYLDVELDLSQVMFIATANVADTIPGPLLDRMEVIRFDGYTSEEKLAIAKGYLWPRQRDRNGLREDEVSVSDEVLRTIIAEYTREAGVRNLERELGHGAAQDRHPDRLGRGGAARGDRPGDRSGRAWTPEVLPGVGVAHGTPGVATGLAVTGTGGDVLFVEATAMKGSGSAGNGLVLTGQLGDVMKESARIALSYVRGHAEELGIDEQRLREQRVPRARAGRRNPQGRP